MKKKTVNILTKVQKKLIMLYVIRSTAQMPTIKKAILHVTYLAAKEKINNNSIRLLATRHSQSTIPYLHYFP